MYHTLKLDADRSALLVIDMQQKLMPLIADHEQVIGHVQRLIRGAALFAVPVIATEQYPQGIGATDPRIAGELQRAAARIHQKLTFSVCGDDVLRAALNELDRAQIIVAGIETHVCVLQTALDLIAQDYGVFVCADATGARGRLDFDVGLQRMRQAGAIVTTVESVLFELCGACGTERFKRMLELIKQTS
ncbi:MAG TPA: hydrolase [Phycisphaerae bacterium]|jgi:nicotinamidase-related amidase